MKRQKLILLLIAATLFMCMPSAYAFADDIDSADDSVYLKSISFNNAELDSEFSPEIYEYTVTLDGSGTTPTLKSYEINGDGNLLITYGYNESNVQNAVIATLNYENNSVIYTFTYSNSEVNVLSSDNLLTDIYCAYCEISPEVNSKDTEYTLYIPSDLTTLTITPVTSDADAVCSPVNLTLTQDQTPQIMLVCTASDGSEREYTVNIVRVDKTIDQVREEMAQSDYVSFVEETKFYEDPEFLFVLICAAAGIAVVALLRFIAFRLNINPYDSDEKPFYKNDENNK